MLLFFYQLRRLMNSLTDSIRINDIVKVRLTEYGKSCYKEYHEEMYSNFPYIKYTDVEEDVDGYSEWQLWELMRVFGNYLTIGNIHVPFTEILFEKKIY